MKLGATVGIGVVVIGLVAGGLVYAHQQHPTTSITKSSQHTSKQTKSATKSTRCQLITTHITVV